MTRLILSASLFFAIGLALGCASESGPEPTSASTAPRQELQVAAASDLKFVLGEIIAAFESEQTDLNVRPTYGSSGNFYSQIVNQAPFDMFLSADVTYPRQVIERKLANDESFFRFATGRLVVWIPKESTLDIESLGIEILTDASIKKIAIANPKHAPYGRAAESSLKTLGIYDQVADRLILGENIAQAAQFLESGSADAGLIAISLALSPGMRDKGRYWIVPESVCPPLEQAGVILDWARDRKAAENFRSFLLNETSRSIFQSHGFSLPAEGSNQTHGQK